MVPESMRRFAGLSLEEGFIPDESTILKFRHFLGEHDLTGEMFSVMDEHLGEKGLRLSTDTIVDATIIHAPSFAKNAKRWFCNERQERHERNVGKIERWQRCQNRER